MLFDCSHSTAGDLKHRRTAALLNPGHAAHVTPPTPPTPTAICGSERPSRAPPDAHDVATSRLKPFPSLSLSLSRRVYNTGKGAGGAQYAGLLCLQHPARAQIFLMVEV